MSYWFIPDIVSDEAAQAAVEAQALILPANGLPDITRAQSVDQIRDWLKHLHPEATPEYITTQTTYYWRLGRELLPEDTVVARTGSGTYMIGDIAGAYRRENTALGMSHVWPVQWRGVRLSAETLPGLTLYSGYSGLSEITNEDALKSLKPYVTTIKNQNAAIFRWVAIGTLIFELIYFWPRGH